MQNKYSLENIKLCFQTDLPGIIIFLKCAVGPMK